MNKQTIEVGTVSNYKIKRFDAFSLSYVLEEGTNNAGKNGSVDIPGWHYNTKALEKFKNRGKVMFKKGIKDIINGETNVLGMINTVAIESSSKYKDVIIKTKSPRNAKSTIERKGFNDPMVDTGKFVMNIGARINKSRIVGRGLWM